MRMDGLKVTARDMKYRYIDFIVDSDSENLYRYEKDTDKIKKLFGIGKNNYGKAISGAARKKVEEMARKAYNHNIPIVIFEI